jgi:hypothetical protein
MVRAVRHSLCEWGSCCWCGKFRGSTGSIVRGKITCREGMKGSTVPSFDIAEIPVLVQKVDMTQFSRLILASYVTHGRTEEPQQSPLGVTLHIRRSGHLSTRSLQPHRRLQSLYGLTRLYSGLHDVTGELTNFLLSGCNLGVITSYIPLHAHPSGYYSIIHRDRYPYSTIVA